MNPTFHWRRRVIDGGSNLFVGRIFVGNVVRVGFTHTPKPWQAWMDHDDPLEVGYFDTEDQAKDALINAVIEALQGTPDV